ncbi:MAG: ACP S-malonyltransferase [Actinomycetota bacterium]
MRESRLLLLGGEDAAALSGQLEELRASASRASSIADPGIGLAPTPSEEQPLRAGVVASDPEELLQRLEVLGGWLGEGEPDGLRAERGLALGRARERPRIGFLFPGQGAPVPTNSGYLVEWLPEAAAVYEQARALKAADEVPPALVQLSVVTASVAGLRALAMLGIEADFGLGHSVGELTALHWAGALDEGAVLRVARRRGEVMTDHATAAGAMANIEADEETFSGIVEGAEVTVACVNSPRHRVVSGTNKAVEEVLERARGRDDAKAVRLRVVGAFHSPLMRDAVPVFDRYLAEEDFGMLQRPVYSTITGAELEPGAGQRALLVRQMTEPVRFLDAVQDAVDGTDLLLEVGPGRMLSGLVAEFAETPTVPLRVGHSSPQGFLTAVGAAYAVGAPIRADRLPGA